METQERLIVDLARLDPDGEQLQGELPASVLDLSADDEVSPKSGLFYDVFAQIIGSELLVRGQVWQRVGSLCSRCGEGFEREIRESEFCASEEILDANAFLDLTEGLREAIILALPAYPLCAEACLGLCMCCGRNLNSGPCDCRESGRLESRWSALDGLKL